MNVCTYRQAYIAGYKNSIIDLILSLSCNHEMRTYVVCMYYHITIDVHMHISVCTYHTYVCLYASVCNNSSIGMPDENPLIVPMNMQHTSMSTDTSRTYIFPVFV